MNLQVVKIKNPGFYCLPFFLLLALPLFFAHAADSDLKISEIMYNPAGNDTNREWIEIVNTGNEIVTLSGGYGAGKWRIEDHEGCHFLKDSASIGPGEYFIITNFKTLADFKIEYPAFNGTIINAAINLSNDSDFIKLIKLPADATSCSNGTVIDSVNYSSSWGAAGDNAGNKSLEKTDILGTNISLNWRESAISGGTPGTENSQLQTSSNPPPQGNTQGETIPGDNQLQTTLSSTQPQQNNQTSSQINSGYSKDVLINEFLPDPIGSDMEREWIEIYNQGNDKVDLSLWQLDDENGGSDPYALPQGTFISPKSYLVFSRQTTNIALNNEGDAVRLFWPDGKIADEISFSGKAPEGQSFNRTDQGWAWSTTLTPGSANIVGINNIPPTGETSVKGENNPQNSQSNNSTENSTAPINQTLKQTTDEQKQLAKANNESQAAVAPIINKKIDAISAIFWGLGIAFFLSFLFFWIKKKSIE